MYLLQRQASELAGETPRRGWGAAPDDWSKRETKLPFIKDETTQNLGQTAYELNPVESTQKKIGSIGLGHKNYLKVILLFFQEGLKVGNVSYDATKPSRASDGSQLVRGIQKHAS